MPPSPALSSLQDADDRGFRWFGVGLASGFGAWGLQGVLFIGPFLVLFPLLVRDTCAGEVRDLSIVLMRFPIGMIGGSLAAGVLAGIWGPLATLGICAAAMVLFVALVALRTGTARLT